MWHLEPQAWGKKLLVLLYTIITLSSIASLATATEPNADKLRMLFLKPLLEIVKSTILKPEDEVTSLRNSVIPKLS